MKNLYIFGDSFSTNFSTIDEVLIEDSWPVLLSNKIGYQLKTYASAGISNFGILNSIYKNSNFDKNDIVIIGITFYDRLYDFWKNIGMDLNNNNNDQFNDIEIHFYQNKILDVNAMTQYTENALLQYNFIIQQLINTTNVYFWNMDKCGLPLFNEMIKKYDKNYLKPFQYKCWIDFCNQTPLWWQKNNDRHFGKIGHKEFSLYLYPYIQSILI
jgi:hypothetical protein